MNGSTHRMFGALCGTAYAVTTGMPPAQAAAERREGERRR